jgi:hypothetical protein
MSAGAYVTYRAQSIGSMSHALTRSLRPHQNKPITYFPSPISVMVMLLTES